MKYWMYILGIWLIFSVSCDPCTECGEPLNYEPTIALSIINQDSLTKLTDSLNRNLDSVAVNDSIESVFRAQLDVFEDSLQILEVLIDEGNNEYLDERDEVLAEIEELSETVAVITTNNDQLDSLRGLINKVISTINSGLILVDNVTLLDNGAEIIFEDSMKVFNLPLLMNQQQTSYRIKIQEKEFSFSLIYELNETLSDARVFRVIATNISLSENYTFDTLIINCPDDICISNETSLTAYF